MEDQEIKDNVSQLGEVSESFVDVENADLSINNDNSYTIYPNAEVRVEKAQFSILHLQTLCMKRKELVINPDFQRNDVWQQRQKSELIESILMGIPIPLMYLFEDKNGKKQVVDGRQRIGAILSFLEEGFKLNNLKILRQLNGAFFSDLDPKLQGVFEDYQLFFYIIQPPTPERVKYDIFDRVNRGGTSLNKQEMRNALYRGRCTNMIYNLSRSYEFLVATGGSINTARMKDQYIILRAIAFLMLHRGEFKNIPALQYRGDIDDFLARFMMYINDDAPEELIVKYENLFLQCMSVSYALLGENGFRFSGNGVRRPINMPLFEALTYLFSFIPKDIDYTWASKLLLDIEDVKDEFDNSRYFSGNIDSTTSVFFRFERMDNIISRVHL
ncbi:DUF262 domain-containing protein [Parabacteroides acidifaciens]|uniref:DUF262 domain-containing protein n=1 Tax=Parabacteroides acidifaciens TaxID=2290935 RepID=A0A3D8HEG2_9BACT|nr:DUF262 domain-containing protein [Parabacteroides acidifaciens]MBC8601905.1 DUF262 domain-containing protein [Parabacteroides acidifaciens]RDU49359.1 DUF262 domain-containing protein [Parabacteroides acidifaciens]